MALCWSVNAYLGAQEHVVGVVVVLLDALQPWHASSQPAPWVDWLIQQAAPSAAASGPEGVWYCADNMLLMCVVAGAASKLGTPSTSGSKQQAAGG
jgi:hypothetical protein